jgi:hypothetical protein
MTDALGLASTAIHRRAKAAKYGDEQNRSARRPVKGDPQGVSRKGGKEDLGWCWDLRFAQGMTPGRDRY